MSTAVEPPPPPPGLVTNDTLHAPTRSLLIGSDASVYPSCGVMTSAYMLTQDVEHYLMACCNLTLLLSHTSYQGELEGHQFTYPTPSGGGNMVRQQGRH